MARSPRDLYTRKTASESSKYEVRNLCAMGSIINPLQPCGVGCIRADGFCRHVCVAYVAVADMPNSGEVVVDVL